MYEMEGPRPTPAPWSADCSAAAGYVAPPVSEPRRPCQSPGLPTFPGCPLGRIPSSVVRDFYCLRCVQHKAFPRVLQDSF